MPCTMIIAKIKKMDITNKVLGENWTQTITITLSDIELNDENLIAIRKFRPNEEVKVHLESLQLSIEEVCERERLKKEFPTTGHIENEKNPSSSGSNPNKSPHTEANTEEIIDLDEDGFHEEFFDSDKLELNELEGNEILLEDHGSEALFNLDFSEDLPKDEKILMSFDFSNL